MSGATLASVHHQFEEAMPSIQQSGRYLFGHRWRDDDLRAELMACAWKAWYGLTQRGRDPRAVGVSGIAA
jgi:hypothetical protein